MSKNEIDIKSHFKTSGRGKNKRYSWWVEAEYDGKKYAMGEGTALTLDAAQRAASDAILRLARTGSCEENACS